MAKEIERKFLLQRVPTLAEGQPSVDIEQGYLAVDEETEVRVRRADQDRFITVKGCQGEVRDEVDVVFEDELDGLLVAEVEFESKAESDEFEPPGWLGKEVTGDDRYSGQSLARRGAPAV